MRSRTVIGVGLWGSVMTGIAIGASAGWGQTAGPDVSGHSGVTAVASAAHALTPTTQWLAAADAPQVPALQRPVALVVRGASMTSVLHSLARQADGQVLYDASVSSLPTRVSIDAPHITLGAALDSVLRGQPVGVFVSRAGDLVVLKRTDRGRDETGSIHGRVTDANSHQPVSDAQVSVVGTNHGAVTDAAGAYLLRNLQPGAVTVRATRIGYTPQSLPAAVTAGQDAALDFVLHTAEVSLDEVVVTAAGPVAARANGSSTDLISSNEFKNAPVYNPQDVIAGRTPGVTLLLNGGAPGAGATIRLRGVNSLSLDNVPVIYVDGVRMYNPLIPAGYGGRQGYLPMDDIAAEDIDHIEIVKGAAATTLYGTEASGGVIQIFTKRGGVGKTEWQADLTSGANIMGHIGPSSDPTGLFINQCRGPNLKDSFGNLFYDPSCPASGTWLHDGEVTRGGLSVRGGSPATRYYVSGNYGDEYGVLQTSRNRLGGVRGNLEFTPSPTISGSLNLGYQKRGTRWAPDGDNSEGLMLNASRGNAGYLLGGAQGDCQNVPSGQSCVVNGYVFSGRNVTDVDHFTGGGTITAIQSSHLTHRFTLGYDFNANTHQTAVPFGFPSVPTGHLYLEQRQHARFTAEYSGALQNTIGSSLSSTFTFGAQAFRDHDRYVENDGTNFSIPGIPTLGTAGSVVIFNDSNLTVVNAGFFVQEVAGWRDRFFLTGGLRVDGNTAFGKSYGLQPYPKLTASYVLSQSSFWPRWWSTMRLRAALGESGKAPGVFDSQRTWSVVQADSGKGGFVPNTLGNPNLGPERTREIEVGFDASAFEERVQFNATAYRARTYNTLVSIAGPPSSGFSAGQLTNVGTLQNSGIELSGSLDVLRSRDITATLRGNYSFLQSTAIDLRGQQIYTFFQTYAAVGYELPTYFGDQIVNPNANAWPILRPNAQLGRQYPNRLLGFGASATFLSHLTVDALFQGAFGGHLENNTAYKNAVRDVWYPCYAVQKKLHAVAAGDSGAINGVPALQRGRCADDGTGEAVFWIESTDFVKLRSVSLTYSLPPRFAIGARAASVSLQARNLFTWTKYSGTDPEVQDFADARTGSLGRRDYYNLPNYRTFLVTVHLSY